MKVSTLSVLEFGYLVKEEDQLKVPNATALKSSDFEYLEQRCLLPDSGAPYGKAFQFKLHRKCRVLQAQNYVGLLYLPSGQSIEILPKTGNHDDVPHARQTLLMMLQSLREFRHIELETADIDVLKLPLIEVLIRRFLKTVNQVVKQGLRRDYVPKQENLTTKRGKLKIGLQVKHNFVEKQRFYCEYDEYLPDIPVNRVIKAAMLQVQRYSKDARNQKLLRELLFHFDDIPSSNQPALDFARIKFDRGMGYYRPAISWSGLILNNLSPVSMSGRSQAPSLLFPMESVFESYVAMVLRRQLQPGSILKTQAASKSLVTFDKSKHFTLKPDLLLTLNDGQQCVLDTKWKRLDLNEYNFGLSQSDFYQMFAYGHKYLNGEGELVLIYPAHAGFSSPIEHSFDFSSHLKLYVVPFEINPNNQNRLILHQNISFKILRSVA
ncbi:McrC family protein [Marinomonas algicola]|uniref:McrC family protein n=1 Tax=Marinomonas algicola TaxID=2773454 RepID=UPI001749436A|nr:McrC family protein [Marinomonas algicola]